MASFFNVPRAPGVPPIRRNPLATANSVLILVTDLIRLFGSTPPWGIYRNGIKIVTADTVAAFDFKRDWSISNYPVEEGAFQSYNKVQIPYDARLRFVAGGDLANRQKLLRSIENIAGDLLLYDVVTPERTWLGMNVTHYDYRKSAANNLGMLTVDVWLEEVRVTATAEFANVKSPSAAGQVNGGTVQPAPATPKQSALRSIVQ